MSDNIYRQLVARHAYPPERMANEYVDEAMLLQSGKGFRFPTESLDTMMGIVLPKSILTILARPSHGKSTLLTKFALHESKKFVGQEEQYVGIITLEESVGQASSRIIKSLGGYSFYDIVSKRMGDIDVIKRGLMGIVDLPIMMFGHGQPSADFKAEPLTIERTVDVIEAVYRTTEKKPSALFVDYLGVIQTSKGQSQQERIRMSNIMVQLGILAKELECPVILAAQASRQADDNADKLPLIGQAFGSSGIEHTSASVMSVMRPRRYWTEEEKQFVKIGKYLYPMSQNLLVAKRLKNRFGDGDSNVVAVNFDMGSMDLRDWRLDELSVGEEW